MEFSTSRDWKWLHGLLKRAFVLRFRLYYGHITRVPWSWFYLKVDNSTENLREGKWKSTTVSKCIKNGSCIGWVHIFTAMCVHLSSVINRIVFYMQCWPLSLHDRICRHCPIFLNFKTLETLWCRLDISFVKNNSWQGSVLTLSLTNSEQGLYSLKKLFYVYECFIPTGTYCSTHMLCAFRCQKRIPNALEFELWTVAAIMWVLKTEFGFCAAATSIHVGEPSLQLTINLWAKGLKYTAS